MRMQKRRSAGESSAPGNATGRPVIPDGPPEISFDVSSVLFVRFDLLRKLLHADELAQPSAFSELHDAGDLREQGVVLAAPDILARLELRPPLPDQNRPSGHELPAECLDTEPLRVG